MGQEKIVIPKNLLPKGPKTKPKNRIDPHKLRSAFEPEPKANRTITYALVKEKAVREGRIQDELMEESIWCPNPVIMEFKMITTQFSHYQNTTKLIAFSAWQRAQMHRNGILIKRPDKRSLPPISYKHEDFGFTDNEKVALREALKYCVINSMKAFNAAAVGFKYHMKEFRLWFGNNYQLTLTKVIEGIEKIHRILSDPNQIITFIDMRYQKPRNGMINAVQRPAPGLATCYGKPITDFISEKYPSNENATHERAVPQHLPVDGMRILIGEHIMHPVMTIQDRALIIYHELTHKILNTIDDGPERLPDDNLRLSLYLV